MLVDDRHLLSHDLSATRRVMTDFVRALGPTDEVALVFVGRSDLSTDFTSDVGTLLATIDSLNEVIGFGLGAWMPPSRYLINQQIGSRGGLHPEELDYLRQTLESLRNAIRSLGAARHVRRSLVFVSAGFNFDPLGSAAERAQSLTMMQELQAAYGEAERGNVPIYTLDPRGMVSAYMAVQDPMALGDTTGGMKPEDQVQEVLRRVRIQQDRLTEIAINTGGRHFINQSNHV